MDRADGYAGLLALLGARPVGRGWDARCPVAGRHRHGDRSPSLRLWVGERGELVARCLGCGAGWGELVAATGTLPRDWWPQAAGALRAHPGRWSVGRVVDIYDYTDDDLEPVAQKTRREPGFNGASKHCSWRRGLPLDMRESLNLSPDAAAWAYGLDEGYYAPHQGDRTDFRACHADQPGAVLLPKVVVSLYRLPELLGADPSHPVCFVEGEGKAKLLAAAGLVSVSPPHGAHVWLGEWGRHFAGRKVIFLPDNDVPGLGLVDVAAGSIIRHGAAGVKVIQPGPEWDVAEGNDIADWLQPIPARERRDKLVELFNRFPSFIAQPLGVRSERTPGPVLAESGPLDPEREAA